MPSKRFLLGIVLVFCVVYVMFIHRQSSYKYYNDTMGMNMADVDLKFDGKVKLTTNNIVYPRETPTEGKDTSYSNYPNSKSSKVAVILSCEGRSGSTWLSSFFWNNPNVFYVYEPLYPSSSNNKAMEQANFSKREGHILQLADTHKCKIAYDKGETLFPMVLGRYPTYQPFLKHCKDSNSCPASLTSYCQSKTHVVQKVIRVTNISDYQVLQKELDIPLKVIHLIRDPRPNIISRERSFDYMYAEGGQRYNSLSLAEKSVQRRKFCLRELSNIKIGDSSLFGANNYIRLTHEEMSLDPIKWVKKLYQFVGLEYTKETEIYIGEITHGKSLVHNGKDPDGRYAGFSVYRDTLTVLYKWMTANSNHIHDIEKECSELLEYLGYVRIYDDNLNKIAENPWPKIVVS